MTNIAFKNLLKKTKKTRYISSLKLTGIFIIFSLIISPVFARTQVQQNNKVNKAFSKQQFSNKSILNNSSLSYSADGGFTGVHSYGIVISCVKGNVSVLQTIHDPKNLGSQSPLRRKSSMSKDEYLELWKKMKRQQALLVQDGPDPIMDIHDEFTISFKIRVGNDRNEFKIHGINRPEGARYFAMKTLLDDATNMTSLWSSKQKLALK